jgi:hypothetical protein
MGHGPHSSKIFVLFYVLFVLCRSVYCLCVNVYRTTATEFGYPIAVNKYIIYRITILCITLQPRHVLHLLHTHCHVKFCTVYARYFADLRNVAFSTLLFTIVETP